MRQRASYEYKDGEGNTIKTMEHRAGWDATFSAPKSVSLTALVGDDYRVREAVRTAMEHLEHYTMARIGGNHPAEGTAKFIAAKPFQSTNALKYSVHTFWSTNCGGFVASLGFDLRVFG